MRDDREIARKALEKSNHELLLRRGRRNLMEYIRQSVRRNSDATDVVSIPGTNLKISFNNGENDITNTNDPSHVYARLLRATFPVTTEESVEWLGTAMNEEALVGLIGIHHKEIYEQTDFTLKLNPPQ